MSQAQRNLLNVWMEEATKLMDAKCIHEYERQETKVLGIQRLLEDSGIQLGETCLTNVKA